MTNATPTASNSIPVKGSTSQAPAHTSKPAISNENSASDTEKATNCRGETEQFRLINQSFTTGSVSPRQFVAFYVSLALFSLLIAGLLVWAAKPSRTSLCALLPHPFECLSTRVFEGWEWSF